RVSHLYQAFNPSVLRLIQQTCQAGQNNGIDVFMCGEMAADPINIPFLVGVGLTRFSMNTVSIPVVKKFIRSLDIRHANEAARTILTLSTVQEITDFVQNEFKDSLPFNETDLSR
ncbi:MAG: phosphoenolpyruvate--protein phosphotransferase, partial [Desulfobacterales bacterium]|nr:phosphoenolpyruvate--protein phosphotransferase [Desulfobacterales bacterium]